MTYRLSSSDRFGEFRHLFRMPLSKVETLTGTLIPRIHQITTYSYSQGRISGTVRVIGNVVSLYILGTGAAFRSCRSLCSISTSEVCLFFFVFIKAHYAMQDRYINMPTNITELNKVYCLFSTIFTQHRNILVHHLYVCQNKGGVLE